MLLLLLLLLAFPSVVPFVFSPGDGGAAPGSGLSSGAGEEETAGGGAHQGGETKTAREPGDGARAGEKSNCRRGK